MLAGDNVRKVAIVGGNRIPFARSNTAYFEVDNQEMLTAALNGLVDRFKLHGERMGEVAAGAVMKVLGGFFLWSIIVVKFFHFAAEQLSERSVPRPADRSGRP